MEMRSIISGVDGHAVCKVCRLTTVVWRGRISLEKPTIREENETIYFIMYIVRNGKKTNIITGAFNNE